MAEFLYVFNQSSMVSSTCFDSSSNSLTLGPIDSSFSDPGSVQFRPDTSVEDWQSSSCSDTSYDFTLASDYYAFMIFMILFLCIGAGVSAILFERRKLRPLNNRSTTISVIQLQTLSVLVVFLVLIHNFHTSGVCIMSIVLHILLLPLIHVFYFAKSVRLLYVFAWNQAKLTTSIATSRIEALRRGEIYLRLQNAELQTRALESLAWYFEHQYILGRTFTLIALISVLSFLFALVTVGYMGCGNLSLSNDSVFASLRCNWFVSIPPIISVNDDGDYSQYCACNGVLDSRGLSDNYLYHPSNCEAIITNTCLDLFVDSTPTDISTLCASCYTLVNSTLVFSNHDSACEESINDLKFDESMACPWASSSPNTLACTSCTCPSLIITVQFFSMLLNACSTCLTLTRRDKLGLRDEVLAAAIIIIPTSIAVMGIIGSDPFHYSDAVIECLVLIIAVWSLACSGVFPVYLSYKFNSQKGRTVRKRKESDGLLTRFHRLASGDKQQKKAHELESSHSKSSQRYFNQSRSDEFVEGEVILSGGLRKVPRELASRPALVQLISCLPESVSWFIVFILACCCCLPLASEADLVRKSITDEETGKSNRSLNRGSGLRLNRISSARFTANSFIDVLDNMENQNTELVSTRQLTQGETTIKTRVLLRFCFENQQAMHIFKSFCAQEFTVENISFLSSIDDLIKMFRSANSPTQLAQESQLIMELYIAPGSPLEVNISSATKNLVISNMTGLSKEEISRVLKTRTQMFSPKTGKSMFDQPTAGMDYAANVAMGFNRQTDLAQFKEESRRMMEKSLSTTTKLSDSTHVMEANDNAEPKLRVDIPEDDKQESGHKLATVEESKPLNRIQSMSPISTPQSPLLFTDQSSSMPRPSSAFPTPSASMISGGGTLGLGGMRNESSIGIDGQLLVPIPNGPEDIVKWFKPAIKEVEQLIVNDTFKRFEVSQRHKELMSLFKNHMRLKKKYEDFGKVSASTEKSPTNGSDPNNFGVAYARQEADNPIIITSEVGQHETMLRKESLGSHNRRLSKVPEGVPGRGLTVEVEYDTENEVKNHNTGDVGMIVAMGKDGDAVVTPLTTIRRLGELSSNSPRPRTASTTSSSEQDSPSSMLRSLQRVLSLNITSSSSLPAVDDNNKRRSSGPSSVFVINPVMVTVPSVPVVPKEMQIVEEGDAEIWEAAEDLIKRDHWML